MNKIITIENPKLVSYLSGSLIGTLELSSEFNAFSDEALLYACLEYSRYTRSHNKHDRLVYLYEKCREFSGVNSLETPKEFETLRNIYYYEISNMDLPFD